MIMEIGVKPPSRLSLIHERKHLRTKDSGSKWRSKRCEMNREKMFVSGMAGCLECRLDWVGTEKIIMDKDCGLAYSDMGSRIVKTMRGNCGSEAAIMDDG